MASLDHIATVFSDYKYDKDVGFESSCGVPCLGCISEIDRDISCECVTNDDPALCVVCKHYNKTCGSIPSELLGAAQMYWNFVARLHGQERFLQRRQIWRIRRALKACGSAWRELEGHLMNPNNLAILGLQESVASRETLTLSIIQSAGASLSIDEIHERLDAVKPPYARHGNCVVALHNALAHLSVSKDVLVGSVEEGMCDSLSDGSPFELLTAMCEGGGVAANCKVVHNGMPDYPRH
ncbi:uncharacterized protein FSUBG_8457 [Fusarium subglutinans]|uniref:Uncharacterized protein n=1 Tax=Gibberella subglutinans TaxID=42677 RepID=A0A8H5PIM4_GIBSU|nr:uncharacterized protein FSUBG_8457 [Fusarium subglutinans]KAF5597625.1 hypothetical protein FSUBG_8457 [Fusarium subglutinans]